MAVRPSEMRTRRGSPAVLWAVVVVVVLAAVGGGVWYFLPTTGPELVVKRYLDATVKGDRTTAASLMVARDRERKRFVNYLFRRDSNPQFKFDRPVIEGDRATVSFTIEHPGVTFGKFDFKNSIVLVKEGRDWRIDAAETDRLTDQQIRQDLANFESRSGR